MCYACVSLRGETTHRSIVPKKTGNRPAHKVPRMTENIERGDKKERKTDLKDPVVVVG
jgi:hypothetical protein